MKPNTVRKESREMIRLVFLLFLWCGFQNLPVSKPPHLSKEVQESDVKHWTWTQEVWITEGDDKYTDTRTELLTRFEKSDKKEELVSELQRDAVQNPTDRLKLFRSMYGIYLLAHYSGTLRYDQKTTDLLNLTKPPYTYEFLRMWFFFELTQNRVNDYVISLGERLAKENSKDYYVIYCLSRHIFIDTPEGKQRALNYANQLIKLDPTNKDGYAALGTIYQTSYILSHAKDSEAGRQEIYYFQEYVKRETPSERTKDNELVQSTINKAKKALAEHEKAAPQSK